MCVYNLYFDASIEDSQLIITWLQRELQPTEFRPDISSEFFKLKVSSKLKDGGTGSF